MSTDPDKFLVRGAAPDGAVNLAVGEPAFLREHLRFPFDWDVFGCDLQSDYPPYKGSKALLDELTWMYPGKHVVVTNGAKGALLAAFYAYRLAGRSVVYHQAPHWPSYSTLAKLSGLGFCSDPITCFDGYGWANHYDHFVTVKTAPNNPDGRTKDFNEDVWFRPGGGWDIWDAAYAHPVYGWNPADLPQHTVSVWSAAKLFGLSGDRVGWLVTGNKAIADAAADYVEKTTSGVNTRGQLIVASVLEFCRTNKAVVDRWYSDARDDLIHNFCSVTQYLGGWIHGGNLLSYSGMFAWFGAPHDFKDALQDAKVLVVPGEACGGKPGWYRMSLGQKPSVTADALQSINSSMWDRRGRPWTDTQS